MNAPASAQWGAWLAQLLATDAPALPTAAAMQIGLHLGWSVVLAWLGVAAAVRWWPGQQSRSQRRWGVALLMALWAWAPGTYSAAYWLGLAFQAPSTVTVLLCAGLLWERLARATVAPSPPGVVTSDRRVLALATLGVLTGWALLLDTFAWLPVQLYAWGFSPAAPGLVLLLVLLPWVFGGSLAHSGRFLWWAVPVALLVLVVWRLPSGNVWDAVLDPLLWLALHGYVARAAWCRYRSTGSGGPSGE